MIAEIAVVATRRGLAIAREGISRLRRGVQRTYRHAAPRALDALERVRDSRWGTATIDFTRSAANTARHHLTTLWNSQFVRTARDRAHQAVTAIHDGPVGRFTRRSTTAVTSTARRVLPDWALDHIRRGRTAWRTAIADNGAATFLRAAAGVATVAVVAAVVMGSPSTSPPENPTAADLPTERSVDDEADRSQDRDTDATEPDDAEMAQPAPEADEEAEKAEEPPAEPEPVGGLNADQMANAVEIVEIGKEMGIPERGQAVALVTAMQESQLLVLANTGIPESMDIPNQGHGQDHDSVGLFQQRPSSGWGTVEECMDVEHSTTVFYKSLKRVKGWEKMDLTVAAQSVQVSAFPDHYAKWEGLAWDIIDEVNE